MLGRQRAAVDRVDEQRVASERLGAREAALVDLLDAALDAAVQPVKRPRPRRRASRPPRAAGERRRRSTRPCRPPRSARAGSAGAAPAARPLPAHSSVTGASSSRSRNSASDSERPFDAAADLQPPGARVDAGCRSGSAGSAARPASRGSAAPPAACVVAGRSRSSSNVTSPRWPAGASIGPICAPLLAAITNSTWTGARAAHPGSHDPDPHRDRRRVRRRGARVRAPVLVDFTAAWCPPCRVMKPVLAELAAERDDLRVVQLDVDADQRTAAEYGVLSCRRSSCSATAARCGGSSAPGRSAGSRPSWPRLL